MTDWRQFGPADFDATLAPRGAAQRAAAMADQGALFFEATPATRAGKRAGPAQLAGQVSIFELEDDGGPPVIPACKPNDFGLCRTCGRDMFTAHATHSDHAE